MPYSQETLSTAEILYSIPYKTRSSSFTEMLVKERRIACHTEILREF
jgi:hypothetical protein